MSNPDVDRLLKAGWVRASDWDHVVQGGDPNIIVWDAEAYWRAPGATPTATPYRFKTALQRLDREQHEVNRQKLIAAGWLESKHAGNRWFPPKDHPARELRAPDGGPERDTIRGIAGFLERFPCSTHDALVQLEKDASNTVEQLFFRGELLTSAVRALPDSVFTIRMVP